MFLSRFYVPSSMRQLVCIAGGLLLGCSACKKETADTPGYKVSGLRDLVVNRNPFGKEAVVPGMLNFEVKYLQGERSNLRLSVMGLPAGLQDSFSTKSATPDFSASLYLPDRGAAAGEYMPELKLQAENSGEVKKIPFKITLTGYATCVDYFANRQLQTELIPTNQGPVINFKSATVRQGANGDTILISNFNNNNEDLKVVFNCATYRLEIPFQFTNRGFIEGYNGFIGIPGTGNNSMPLGFNFSVQEVINNVQSYYSLYYTFE